MTRLRKRRKKGYYNNKRKKIYTILLLIIIFLLLRVINSFFTYNPNYKIKEVSSVLEKYFNLEEKYQIEWYYLAAMDDLENKLEKSHDKDRYEELYSLYLSNDKNIEKTFIDFKGESYKKKLLKRVNKFKQIDKVYRNKEFPLDRNVSYTYEDGWGASRSYGGERSHEGIDLIADKGTAIKSVGEGKVTNIGWNELGGWRIGIKGDDGIYYYYAHLENYQEEMERGKKVNRGDIIGYVGNTGYGPEGTSGEFIDHLHFGMYENNIAINPYPFLKAWESK